MVQVHQGKAITRRKGGNSLAWDRIEKKRQALCIQEGKSIIVIIKIFVCIFVSIFFNIMLVQKCAFSAQSSPPERKVTKILHTVTIFTLRSQTIYV